MTTFLAIAENSKLDFIDYSCQGEGKLEKVDDRYMISEIILTPQITVRVDKDIERAQRIIEKAEHHCLISNSVKTNIVLNPIVITKPNEG